MKKLIGALVIGLSCCLSSSASANYIGMSDFDWPQNYWDEHEEDTTVACAHIALANALFYWDQKFPDLIPTDFGSPQSMDFTDEHGTEHTFNTFWNLMSALADDKYLGPGDVATNVLGRGIQQWFSDRNVGLSFHTTAGMGFDQKWDFYKKMVDKGEVPLILLEIDSGNHWVTGTGYSGDSLTIFDPNIAGTGAQSFTVSQQAGKEGWYINYENELARIWSVQAVTAVPEPTSALLLASGLLVLVGFGAKRPID